MRPFSKLIAVSCVIGTCVALSFPANTNKKTFPTSTISCQNMEKGDFPVQSSVTDGILARIKAKPGLEGSYHGSALVETGDPLNSTVTLTLKFDVIHLPEIWDATVHQLRTPVRPNV